MTHFTALYKEFPPHYYYKKVKTNSIILTVQLKKKAEESLF